MAACQDVHSSGLIVQSLPRVAGRRMVRFIAEAEDGPRILTSQRYIAPAATTRANPEPAASLVALVTGTLPWAGSASRITLQTIGKSSQFPRERL